MGADTEHPPGKNARTNAMLLLSVAGALNAAVTETARIPDATVDALPIDQLAAVRVVLLQGPNVVHALREIAAAMSPAAVDAWLLTQSQVGTRQARDTGLTRE